MQHKINRHKNSRSIDVEDVEDGLGWLNTGAL